MSSAPDTGTFGERPFQQFVSAELPTKTLEELTGNHFYAQKQSEESGLEGRVRIAWTKPAFELSCAEVRMLVGQKLGLDWLAKPVAEIVGEHPQLECDLYAGDLTTNALLAWRELHTRAPVETERMLASDFSFLESDPEAENPKSIIRNAIDALASARSTLAP